MTTSASSRPTVFLFVANYLQITDLIYSGFLQELAMRLKVIVFLPTLDGLSRYPQHPNLIYQQWEIERPQFWGRAKLLRVGLINVFDGLLSTQVHYLRAFSDWRRRWLRYVARLWPLPLTPRLFTRLEALSLRHSRKFASYVQQYQPQAVLVGTPGFTDLEAEVIILARQGRLPTIAINFSWDNLTTNAKHLRRVDFLLTWNEAIKREALRWHTYQAEQVFVSGPMRFDQYFTSKVVAVRPPTIPLIVLSTTSHGVYPFHVELINQLLALREQGSIPFCHFLIRVHPKDDAAKYQAFTAQPGVSVELAGQLKPLTGGSRHKIELSNSDLTHLQTLFQEAAMVINYTSTITLEALAMGCPVINIAFPSHPIYRHYEYEHYQPVIQSGAVWVARDTPSLAQGINCYLTQRDANQEQRNKLVSDFFYRLDGQAHQRAAAIVEEIVTSRL